MKKNRQILFAVLAVLLLASLIGCGSSAAPTSGSAPSTKKSYDLEYLAQTASLRTAFEDPTTTASKLSQADEIVGNVDQISDNWEKYTWSDELSGNDQFMNVYYSVASGVRLDALFYTDAITQNGKDKLAQITISRRLTDSDYESIDFEKEFDDFAAAVQSLTDALGEPQLCNVDSLYSDEAAVPYAEVLAYLDAGDNAHGFNIEWNVSPKTTFALEYHGEGAVGASGYFIRVDIQ